MSEELNLLIIEFKKKIISLETMILAEDKYEKIKLLKIAKSLNIKIGGPVTYELHTINMRYPLFFISTKDLKSCSFRSERFIEREVMTFKEITKPIIEYCKTNKIIE